MENTENNPVTATGPDYNHVGHTYSDYKGFEIDEMVEVIRGKLFTMSPAPGSTHQMVSINLTGMLWSHFIDSSSHIITAPYDVILPIANLSFENAQTIVQPDICIICDKNKIKERGCFGAPDLIIEILSPHTSKKDIQLKYQVYEEAGVTEFWVVMPGQQIVEVYVLHDGRYDRYGAYAWEDTVTSYLFPEIRIALGDVFGERMEQ